MIGSWWENRKKKKQIELEQQFDQYIAAKKAAEEKEEIDKAIRAEELKKAALALEEQRDLERKNSDEPWVRVESATVDASGVMSFKLDWNPAFIKYLKTECNFTGDDDRIIQQYLGALYREMHDDGKNTALDILKTPGYEKVELKPVGEPTSEDAE
jgi:hypothetical protein